MPEPGVQSARTRVNFTSAVSLCNVEGEFRILAGIPYFSPLTPLLLGKGLFLLDVKLSCVSTFPAERMSPTDILLLLTSSSDFLELHNLTRHTRLSTTLWRRMAISNTPGGFK